LNRVRAVAVITAILDSAFTKNQKLKTQNRLL
jgi:hypothetical protein